MESQFQNVYRASNEFGLKLLQQLTQDQLTQNIFFSPLSISMCLTLAANGAGGETQREILQALSLGDLSFEDINRANQHLMSRFNVEVEPLEIEDETEESPWLDDNGIRVITKRPFSRATLNKAYRVMDIVRNSDNENGLVARLGEDWMQQYREAIAIMMSADIDKRFKVSLANSLWLSTKINLEENFISMAREFYKARVANVDFSDSTTPQIINGWIRHETQGAIREVVGTLPPATVWIIANAIYFKAFWQIQFSQERTKISSFYLHNGDQIQCHMMYQEHAFRYWEDDDLQMINIPYEPENDLSYAIYIILPKHSQDLNRLLSELSIERWDSLVEKVNQQWSYGLLGLPRFKAEFEREILDDLMELGMKSVSNSRANFSSMSKTPIPLQLSGVIHKAFIKVDEEGTEAGAATIAVYAGGKFSREAEFEMIVDHPFIYAIRDIKTGLLLFMGVTMQPS